MNTISDERIAKINASSKLILKRRGDAAVEFYNAANRLYVLQFVEVAEMGSHRVLYFMLRLAEGERGGAPDRDTGRMIIAVIAQYLDEHPDDLVCYCHPDNAMSLAANRIFHLWARVHQELLDACSVTIFDGVGHDAEKNQGLHFTVIYNQNCQDIAELKNYILENSDEFAASVREQIVLLHDIELKTPKPIKSC